MLVRDQCCVHGAPVNQHAHVDRVAGQSRRVHTEDDPNLLLLDHPQQAIEVVSRHRLAGRLALVGLKELDLAGRPTELFGTRDQTLLNAIAFGVVPDLTGAALPNVDSGQTSKMFGLDFMTHDPPPS